MSWSKVDGRQSFTRDVVRIALRQSAIRGVTRISLELNIGSNIWHALGWNRDCRVDVYWGEGKDFSWIKIVRSDSGRLKLRGGTKSDKSGLYTGIVGLSGHVIRKAVSAMNAKHVILGDELLIKIPAVMWSPYEKKARPQANGHEAATAD
jgi:hypothetical protein